MLVLASRTLFGAALLPLWFGCAAGPANGVGAGPKASAPPIGTAPIAERSAAPGTVRRSRVEATVAQGLGAFLRHVEVSEEPVFKKGEFFGFAIARLLPAEDWSGIDLQPGDVVSQVNGMAIEKPEQAYLAFMSAPRGKEIVVNVERAGRPRIVRVPIVE